MRIPPRCRRRVWAVRFLDKSTTRLEIWARSVQVSGGTALWKNGMGVVLVMYDVRSVRDITQKAKQERKALHMRIKAAILVALLVASVASAQLIYDEVKVEVADGVTCPSSWTASSETVMSEPRFQVHVPVVLDCDAERMGS